MIEGGGSRRGRLAAPFGAAAAVVGLIATCLTSPAPALAVGACDAGADDRPGTFIARDYTAPFTAMPRLRPVPGDGHLPFGPRGIRIHGSGVQLMLPAGYRGWGAAPPRAGFSLSIPSRSGRLGNPNFPTLRWTVTAKLTRVDARGRVKRLIDWRRKRVSGPGDRGGIALQFPGTVAFYRLEIVFRNGAGRRLGRFGEYVRVLPVRPQTRLTLNRTALRPGEALAPCLENLGTTTFLYGGCVGALQRETGPLYGIFQIQRSDGSGWSAPPWEKPTPCAGVGLSLGPGFAAPAGSYRLPEDAPPGRYRAVVGKVTAEFDVIQG